MALFSSKPDPAPVRPMTPTPTIETAPARIRLSAEDLAKLSALEGIVDEGLRAFKRAGQALAAIRARQWFRATHDDFASYVADRWKMTPQHASRLIEASVIAANLEPLGDETGAQPTSERQVRPLAGLDPDQQRAAWRDAVENAPKSKGGTPKITGEIVEAAAAKLRPKGKRRKGTKAPKPIRFLVPGATVVVIPNRKFHGTPEDALRAALEKLAQTPRQAAA